MDKIVREKPESTFDEAYAIKLVTEFQNHKAMLETTQKRVDVYKKELNEMLIAHGKPDEKGNLWINTSGFEIKRERRVSKTFNADAAEAWAKETDKYKCPPCGAPKFRFKKIPKGSADGKKVEVKKSWF